MSDPARDWGEFAPIGQIPIAESLPPATEAGGAGTSLVDELHSKRRSALDNLDIAYKVQVAYCSAYQSSAEIAARHEARWQTDRKALGNLLAVIFGDGGHRQTEIGDTDAAWREAHERLADKRAQAAEAQRDYLARLSYVLELETERAAWEQWSRDIQDALEIEADGTHAKLAAIARLRSRAEAAEGRVKMLTDGVEQVLELMEREQECESILPKHVDEMSATEHRIFCVAVLPIAALQTSAKHLRQLLRPTTTEPPATADGDGAAEQANERVGS